MINYKKITILTILSSLILTPNIAQASVKKPTTPQELSITFSVEQPRKPGYVRTQLANLPNQYIYTINSKYNTELGCTTPINFSDDKTPITRQEDGYLCNADKSSEFVSQEVAPAKYNKAMLTTREKISNSRIVIKDPKYNFRYNTKIKVNEYTIGAASCNEQQLCSFFTTPAYHRLGYFESNDGIILPATPLEALSDSKIIFSKFSDGVNPLPNFLSEVNTIKFLSAYNTVLYEVKPKTSPLYMSNYFLTNVPLRTNKVEICTNYDYCFTTRLEDTIATYLEDINQPATFALNITNTNLANYQKVGINVQNANFETANFEKTHTLKYTLKESGNDTVKATRIGTNHPELQSNNKINKNYLNPEICDDTTCIPATLIPSSNCPNNPTICLTATFTPIKKKTVVTGQLIQPDGSPAPFGTLVFYPNRDYFSTAVRSGKDFFNQDINVKKEIYNFIGGDTYRNWPEYKKIQRFSADKNGMITFTQDLDHYYSKVERCNINSCHKEKKYLFDQTKYELPNQGKSLLITVPSNQYTEKNKKDPAPIKLKPGMFLSGKVLADANYKPNLETYGILTTKYLSPGSYLQTYDSSGAVTLKTLTDEEGRYVLTLPTSFTRLEICSASNICHSEINLNKFYYINIEQKDIPTAKIFTFPAPKDNVGMLRGKLYGGSNEILNANKKKNIPNKEVYLLNAKGELVTTLKTDANGEFTKNLNYLIANKVTMIASCKDLHQVSANCVYGTYNEINYGDYELYFNAQVNYPYQVVSGYQTLTIMESTLNWISAIVITAGIAVVGITLL